jgi:ribosomal protein L7Ae-like RNA K-turn-binding protein
MTEKGIARDRALSMLGIAAKAGKVVSGEFATENAVKAGKAFLVITAEDASENTRKKFRDMADFYHLPILSYGTKDTLGGCIGKDYRSSLAVTDEKLAEAVRNKIDGSSE